MAFKLDRRWVLTTVGPGSAGSIREPVGASWSFGAQRPTRRRRTGKRDSRSCARQEVAAMVVRLFVGNLSFQATEEDVRGLFQHGEPSTTSRPESWPPSTPTGSSWRARSGSSTAARTARFIATVSSKSSRAPTREMLESGQRVTVDLSGLVIKGVSFSGNVKKALGTIVQQVSAEPPVYLVDPVQLQRDQAGGGARGADPPGLGVPSISPNGNQTDFKYSMRSRVSAVVKPSFMNVL